MPRAFPMSVFSELQDRRRDQVGRGHTFRVVQIQDPPTLPGNARVSRRRDPWQRDRRTAQRRRHSRRGHPDRQGRGRCGAVSPPSWKTFTSHLEVDLGPRLGYCLRGCQELIERRVSTVLGAMARACQGAHATANEYGARSAKATDADSNGDYRGTRSVRRNAPSCRHVDANADGMTTSSSRHDGAFARTRSGHNES